MYLPSAGCEKSSSLLDFLPRSVVLKAEVGVADAIKGLTMKSSTLKHELWEVVNRLNELNLQVAPIRESVRRGYLASASCTLNHPPLMRGIVGWGEIVCALREHLASAGWHGSDDDNYSVVVDPTGRTAIAVATGDHATGNRNASPTTKSAKGPHTVTAVEGNISQMSLFDEPIQKDLMTDKDAVGSEGRSTWILLVYRDVNELRCELSLPAQIDDGHINGWLERIILDPIPLDGDPVEVTSPSQPDLDIDVRRRTA